MSGIIATIVSWVDSEAFTAAEEKESLDWFRVIPFIFLHIAVLLVIYAGISLAAVVFCLALYVIRMFAITAFYHRYFSHKTFKTTRFTQFVFAFICASSVQRGPLWWAAHHRHHHGHSDEEDDAHSPVQKGFFWSHMGWFLSQKHFPTKKKYVKDWSKYPELVFLNRFDVIAPTCLAFFCYFFGEALQYYWPALQTSGFQFFVWGFVISTVVLYHATFTINSLAHVFGSRPFETTDDSRNNRFLAIITLGTGPARTN